MTTAASGAAQETRWPLILLLVGAGYCVSLQAGKLPAAIPALTGELGVDIVAAGWLVSAVTAIAAIAGVFTGGLAQRIGGSRMVLTGLMLNATGCAIGALAPNVAVLMASRVIEGAGFIATVVAVPPLLLSLSRARDAPLVMGAWTTYMPVGMGMMLALAPALMHLSGWRGLWWINGTAAALWALLLMAELPAWREGRREPVTVTPAGPTLREDIAAMLHAAAPAWLALSFAAYASQFLAVMAFLPVLLSETAGIAPSHGALFTALAVLLNGVGNLLGGVALRRGASYLAAVAVASLAMALGAVMVFGEGFPVGVRLAGACGFCLVGGAIPAVTFARVPALAVPERLHPACIGLLTQGAAVGQFVGPPLLAGIVKDLGGWSWAPLYTVACAALCILAAWLADADRGRGGGQP
jgi:MFS family permease